MKIFNIASFKRDEQLEKTIASIYNQSDKINVSLNSHLEIPSFLKDPKINPVITDNSLGDGHRYFNLENENGFFFTCDDDIIYPKNYAEVLIDRYEPKKILTFHGRSFKKFPISSYYNSPRTVYHFLHFLGADVRVQFGGTGVMMFNTNDFRFKLEDIKYPNMADILVAKFAKEQRLEIICVKHNVGFLQYQADVKATIFKKHQFDDSKQTTIANEMFHYNNRL